MTTFDSEKSCYVYRGHPVPHRVTQVVSHFFPRFNPRTTAMRIVNTLTSISRQSNQWSQRQAAYWKRNTQYHDCTLEQILLRWRENSETARVAGLKLHRMIEETDLGMKPDCQSFPQEMANFRVYDQSVKGQGWKHHGSEVMISNGIIGGTVDRLLIRDGKLLLEDWKHTKAETYVSKIRAFPPFESLTDQKCNRYRVQLNLYRYLLEQEGYVVEEMRVIRLLGSEREILPMAEIDRDILEEALKGL